MGADADVHLLEISVVDVNTHVDGIYVGGNIVPDLELQYTIPESENLPEGGFDIVTGTSSMLMSQDDESQAIVISRSSVDGNSPEEENLEEPLHNVVLRVHEGLPIWESIDQRELVPAD